jgi:integrase
MKRRKSLLPPYVHCFRDRHGTIRSAFRRGSIRVPLPVPLYGAEWQEAYRTAVADYIAGREPSQRSQIGAERTKPGTFAAGFIVYTGSAKFKELRESTQRVHFNILSRLRDQYGDRRLNQLQRRHVIDWLNERTPSAAEVLLKVVRRMMQYCVLIELIEIDPTVGVKAPKYQSTGYHTWTDDELAQYRRRHPLGSNARTALELLIGTAQRRSDVVRMGRQHLRDGGAAIHVEQKKTGWQGEIPLGPELVAALQAVPAGNLTFLTTAWGAPFTAAGFGNIFRDWCNQAGLPHCSSHGLRKAACTQLAEAGCTAHEIAAISGHLSLS